MPNFNTLSLIGMPGSGKSTVGVILAKMAGLAYRDTDLDIQRREGKTLQDILEREGYLYLRQVEEEVLLDIPLKHTVIATGGSVVYSKPAMERLKEAGPVINLQLDFQTLSRRVATTPGRGIASDPRQSFEELYAERVPLYARYADFMIDATAGSADEIAASILASLSRL